MSIPVYPNDACVEVLRGTVENLMSAGGSIQQITEVLGEAMRQLAAELEAEDWSEVGATAGMVASLGLVLQLHALARRKPKAKA